MRKFRKALYLFWEQGYLYALFAMVLFLMYSLNKNVGVMDWYKDSAYLHYIKTSLTDYNTLPYFWWSKISEISWIPPVRATSIFISIPETSLFSPLTPLILFLSEIVYLKIYILVQCLAGLFGVFALKERLHWNNLQFRTYLAIFIFSPIVFQHIAVGYLPWYNLFLFPWLVFFLVETITIRKIIGIAIVNSLVLLQGGVYVFVWFSMILILYALFQAIVEKKVKDLFTIATSYIFVFLLANVRIYTASLSFVDFSREWFEIGGYNPFSFLFFALIPTITIQPLDLLFWTNLLWLGITPHDAGIFWGMVIIMVGVLLLFYKKIFNTDSYKSDTINYRSIFFVSIIIFTFSFFSFWASIMKAVQSVIEIPFFESIKNYGYRLGIPAYLGFSLVVANYIKDIWKILHKATRSKLWQALMLILKRVFRLATVVVGAILVTFIAFKRDIVEKLNEIVLAAYTNTGHFWLRNRMEGIESNNVEFYYARLENFYLLFLKILMILLIVLLSTHFIILLIRLSNNLIRPIYKRFKYLGLEIALVLPLMFSTFMWIHLATRTPFDFHARQQVTPPTVVVETENKYDMPEIIVTPKNMIIQQKSNIMPGGYLFPQILARDYKHLTITTKNATLFDKQGILKINPIDDQDIIVDFNTKTINLTLIITLCSWVCALLLFYISKKRLKE